MAGKIINSWARPIFNLTTDYKSVSKEERQERDDQIAAAARRRQQEANTENEEALRPGDKGWCYRARVPQVQQGAYVQRPKWSSDVDIQHKSRGDKNRFDKYLKVASDRKKGSKTKRAVDISIEGRKMAL